MRAPYSVLVGSPYPGIVENPERLTWESRREGRTLSAGLQTATSSLVLALQSITPGSASKQLPLLSKSSSRKLSSERSWRPKEPHRCVYPRPSWLTRTAGFQTLPGAGVSPVGLRLRELGSLAGRLTHAASPWRRGRGWRKTCVLRRGKRRADVGCAGLRRPVGVPTGVHPPWSRLPGGSSPEGLTALGLRPGPIVPSL